MHLLFSAALMSFLLLMGLMYVSIVKEGGSISDLGPIVFDFIKERRTLFVSTWGFFTVVMYILTRALTT